MSGRSGFVGLRLATTAALISTLGIGAVYGAWRVLRPEQDRAVVRLEQALEARAEAGAGALEALDAAQAELEAAHAAALSARRAAAEGRATELALLAAAGPVPDAFAPIGGELLGRVWPAEDRLEGLGEAGSSTTSVARPELAAALSAAPEGAAGPLEVRAVDGIYAVAPGPAGGPRAVAFVPLPRPTPPRSLDAARAALGNLADVEPTPSPLRAPEPWLALAGLLGAALVFLWAQLRVSGPLRETLEAARAFVHGDPSARADEDRGGAEAREVARAVNGLVERAARLESQGRAAREEDIQAAAVAIEALGKGDLRAVTPRLAAPFGPVSRALDRARKDLLARVEALHEVSRAVAQDAVTMAPGARTLAAASLGQREALERLSEGLAEAERQVLDARTRLEAALEGVSTSAAAQRRTTQEIRTTMSLVGRRLADVSAAAARVQALAASAQSIESALGLLGTWAASAGASEEQSARATQLVGEGRAALAALTTELAEVEAELAQASERLSAMGAEPIDAPPDPSRAVADPLYAAASGLARASELLGRGLSGWERAARGVGQETAAVARAAELAAGRLSGLSEALSELRVGEAFEEVLLERLERARAQIDAAGQDGLTPDGEALVAEIEAAAEAARVRVGHLLRATEATLDVLRRS